MQIFRRDFVQKQEVTWGHGQHQWIEQRLAYQIEKYGQILLSNIGVLEFKKINCSEGHSLNIARIFHLHFYCGNLEVFREQRSIPLARRGAKLYVNFF